MIEEVGNEEINVRKKALIIIDMQKDYLWDKRKPIFNYDTESLVGNVNRVIDLYKNEGYDIIYIKYNRFIKKLILNTSYLNYYGESDIL